MTYAWVIGVVVVAVLAFALLGRKNKEKTPAIIPTVAALGDSTLWGNVGDFPGRLAVPPCVRINELLNGRLAVNDYSYGGCTSKAALEGRANFPPLSPFADWIKTISDKYVLIKYGGADGFLEDTSMQPNDQLAAFKWRMEMLVQFSQEASKTVVLVTSVRPATPLTQFIPLYDEIIRQVSNEQSVSLIDVSANVPFNGLSDLCVDEIHAGQDYSDRICGYIVSRLREITNS